MHKNKHLLAYIVGGLAAVGIVALAATSSDSGFFKGQLNLPNPKAEQNFLTKSQSCFAKQNFYPAMQGGELVSFMARNCHVSRINFNLQARNAVITNLGLSVNGTPIQTDTVGNINANTGTYGNYSMGFKLKNGGYNFRNGDVVTITGTLNTYDSNLGTAGLLYDGGNTFGAQSGSMVTAGTYSGTQQGTADIYMAIDSSL